MGCTKDLCCHFRFAVVVGIVTELATQGGLCELLYVDDLINLIGSNLSFSGDLTNEIQRCITLASSAFGRLSKRVFCNQNLTIHTKIAIYDAVVISTILYDCDS